MRYALLLLCTSLTAGPFAGSVEEELLIQRGDCLDQMEETDNLHYWIYLSGRVDQIDLTLKIMGE